MDSLGSNDFVLQAIQPLVDIFWSLVYSATGSTVTVPRPDATNEVLPQ